MKPFVQQASSDAKWPTKQEREQIKLQSMLMSLPTKCYNLSTQLLQNPNTKYYIYSKEVGNLYPSIVAAQLEYGQVKVSALSPAFGFYASDNQILPMKVSKLDKNFNVAIILYSIDRKHEFLNDMQRDFFSKGFFTKCITLMNNFSHFIAEEQKKERVIKFIKDFQQKYDKKQHEHTVHFIQKFSQSTRFHELMKPIQKDAEKFLERFGCWDATIRANNASLSKTEADLQSAKTEMNGLKRAQTQNINAMQSINPMQSINSMKNDLDYKIKKSIPWYEHSISFITSEDKNVMKEGKIFLLFCDLEFKAQAEEIEDIFGQTQAQAIIMVSTPFKYNVPMVKEDEDTKPKEFDVKCFYRNVEERLLFPRINQMEQDTLIEGDEYFFSWLNLKLINTSLAVSQVDFIKETYVEEMRQIIKQGINSINEPDKSM
ncbi:Conserved_hypothetical protein [Hexamita inflata]|uniref:Uncharacterized protein n=1 Tax=Hexamita inflata TaxID=28002 RepID=A0AA86QFM7_9EUKA|nr:Conserved hypothetical protein [Hexamita inflata]CAI9952189.1 Conserved hypothetical protein [Hexamita inflata]